jgi:hypothetical protein
VTAPAGVVYEGPDGEARRLPPGERVLWTGSPDARALARNFFRERWILGFIALTFGGPLMVARGTGVTVLTIGLLAVAVAGIRFFAWRLAKTSQYVITDRRVYFNIGIVLRADANVPYTVVDSVDLRRCRDGSGDLSLTMTEQNEIPWLLLFPHVRWRGSSRGRPTLRGLTSPQAAADAVVEGLRAYATTAGVVTSVVPPVSALQAVRTPAVLPSPTPA